MLTHVQEIVAWWCDVCVKIWSPVIDRIRNASDNFMG